MKKFTYIILGLCFFLFSCERKVVDSKSSISVFLPGDSTALQSITDPLNSVSVSSTANGDDSDEFNSTIPLDGGNAVLYPVNCYIVAVSSLNPETAFSKNYCGKKSTISGRVTPEYKFGPFMALVKPGTSFELEVPSGDKRVLHVFALHAQNPDACRILTAGNGENPSKETFSKPHFVGTSAPFSVLPGKTTTVPMNLLEPVATSAIDDCVFTSLGHEQTVANTVAIERNSFPENILVTALSNTDTNPNSYRCDYVDIVPKLMETNGTVTKFNNARFDSERIFTVSHDALGGNDPTFRSKVDCENDSNSSTNFLILPTDQKVRRWFKLSDQLGTGTIANFKARSFDNKINSEFKEFKLLSGRVISGTELISNSIYYRAGFDISIPKKIVAGECYPVFFLRKAIEGYPIASAPHTVLSITQSPSQSASFYNTSDCGSAAVGTLQINSGFYFGSYYFKATQSFELSVLPTLSGTPFYTPIEPSAVKKIEVVASSPSLQPEFVELTADDVFSWHPNSSISCQPMIFRFKNKDGVVVKLPNSGQIEVLFGQSSNLSTNQFSSLSNCTSGFLNAGTVLPMSAGSEFAKIYVNNASEFGEGLRTVRFKVFDGTKYHYLKHTFEVVKPNYLP